MVKLHSPFSDFLLFFVVFHACLPDGSTGGADVAVDFFVASRNILSRSAGGPGIAEVHFCLVSSAAEVCTGKVLSNLKALVLLYAGRLFFSVRLNF